MRYDFDEVVDRSHNFATKYDERVNKFGTNDVIPLWVADMDFKTAQPVIDALTERAAQGIFGYTSRPDSYFQAICDWQKKRNGWVIDPASISYALGVVPALSSIVREFTKPGDKVLIQTPVYSEFYAVAEAWDREVVENPLVLRDGVYTVDFDDFERKLADVSLFLLCSPHNPVGRVWSREELTRMAELCLKHGVRLISDEIHSDLVFWGKKHIPTATLSPEIASNVITCISGTKTFNLAGLQASATVFPDRETKARYDAFWHRLDIERNNAFSLVAMEAAFREGEEWLEQLLRYLEGNFLFVRDYCQKNIPAIVPSVPEATYLIWLDCRALGMDNEALRRFMIEKAGLGLNEGHAYGRSLTGFMRLNAACPRAVLEKALGQLKAAVDAL